MLWLQRRHPCGSHSSANSFSAIGLKLQIFMSRSRERENKESQGHEMNRRFQRLPSLPSSSVGICYIWCTDSPPFSLPHPPVLTPPLHPPTPCASMLYFVAPQLAALLAPTNLFLTLITARQQAAVQWAGQMKGSNLLITGGLLFSPHLFSWATSVTGQQWIFVFFLDFSLPPQHRVKGGFFKGSRKGSEGWRASGGRWSLGREGFLSGLRVEASQR